MSWKSVQWDPRSMRTDGQTDRHDEANNRFSKFCERAEKEFCSLVGDLNFSQEGRPVTDPPSSRALSSLQRLVIQLVCSVFGVRSAEQFYIPATAGHAK